METVPPATVDESFLEPALRLVRDYCRQRRDTPELSDEQFLRFGILRVMGQCDSGRDFLRAQQDRGAALARSTWFDALHSRRRGTSVHASSPITVSCVIGCTGGPRLGKARPWRCEEPARAAVRKIRGRPHR